MTGVRSIKMTVEIGSVVPVAVTPSVTLIPAQSPSYCVIEESPSGQKSTGIILLGDPPTRGTTYVHIRLIL